MQWDHASQQQQQQHHGFSWSSKTATLDAAGLAQLFNSDKPRMVLVSTPSCTHRPGPPGRGGEGKGEGVSTCCRIIPSLL